MSNFQSPLRERRRGRGEVGVRCHPTPQSPPHSCGEGRKNQSQIALIDPYLQIPGALGGWSKVGSSLAFDSDRGFPAPCFRLGFPVIQPRFYNTVTGGASYLMITPSGGHAQPTSLASSNCRIPRGGRPRIFHVRPWGSVRKIIVKNPRATAARDSVVRVACAFLGWV
jgi:hypothetical protein